jgi:hypothetical protein
MACFRANTQIGDCRIRFATRVWALVRPDARRDQTESPSRILPRPAVRLPFSFSILLVVTMVVVAPGWSVAHADDHAYFLAATIDDPDTIKSVCKAEKTITDKVGQFGTYVPGDLHVSLIRFDKSQDKKYLDDHNLSDIVKKELAYVLEGKGQITLFKAVEGGRYKVFLKEKNPPGYLVFQLPDPGILKSIANGLETAIEKANAKAKADGKGQIKIDGNDFNLTTKEGVKTTNGHFSFARFDPSDKTLSKSLQQFHADDGKGGSFNIVSPNANHEWVLYEIDLKHSEGNPAHYVNVESWILPDSGPKHPATPATCPNP